MAHTRESLNTSVPGYIRESIDLLQTRLGLRSRSATVEYLLDTALIYQLGIETVDKLYEHEEDLKAELKARRISPYAMSRDNLYHDAKLIASAPNMSDDVNGIYQALKAGESLVGFQLIG